MTSGAAAQIAAQKAAISATEPASILSAYMSDTPLPAAVRREPHTRMIGLRRLDLERAHGKERGRVNATSASLAGPQVAGLAAQRAAGLRASRKS